MGDQTLIRATGEFPVSRIQCQTPQGTANILVYDSYNVLLSRTHGAITDHIYVKGRSLFPSQDVLCQKEGRDHPWYNFLVTMLTPRSFLNGLCIRTTNFSCHANSINDAYLQLAEYTSLLVIIHCNMKYPLYLTE